MLVAEKTIARCCTVGKNRAKPLQPDGWALAMSVIPALPLRPKRGEERHARRELPGPKRVLIAYSQPRVQ
jgi:hypothetical protein